MGKPWTLMQNTVKHCYIHKIENWTGSAGLIGKPVNQLTHFKKTKKSGEQKISEKLVKPV